MSLRVAYRRVVGLIASGLCKITSKSAVWGLALLHNAHLRVLNVEPRLTEAEVGIEHGSPVSRDPASLLVAS